MTQPLPLTRFVDPARPITYGIVQAGDHDPSGIAYIRPVDMDGHNGVPDASALRRTSAAIAAAYDRSTVQAGDLVVSIGPSFGKVMIVPPELAGANLTQGTARVAPAPNVNVKFLYWALQAKPTFAYWESVVSGATFSALNLEPLSRTPIPVHDYTTQRVIANFLDAETARIDALVEKKKRLSELVLARHVAVVSQAVKRGLDAQVETRDSGTDWIGAVPLHWQVKRIKRLCQVRRGASPRPIDDPVYFDDEGEYAWVRISDVTAAGRYLRETEQRLSVIGSSKSVKLEPGALFLSIAGSVGKPVITTIKCCIHDGFVYFVGLTEEPEFLYFVLGTGDAYGGLGKLGTQLNLNTETVGNIRVPVPPRDEQEAIVAFLDGKSKKVDYLIATLTSQIELLNEHREALVTAAVTGELDVAVAA